MNSGDYTRPHPYAHTHTHTYTYRHTNEYITDGADDLTFEVFLSLKIDGTSDEIRIMDPV